MDAGKELAKGRDLTALRRATAAAARAALDRLAGESYPGDWRRFELEELPYSEPLPIAQGTLQVYPALALVDGLVQVRLHWTPAEAERQCADAAVELARRMLGRQCRDLAKRVAENARLLLAASPYLRGDALVDVLLRLTLRRACFSGSSTPRTRAEFERTVDQARAGLFAALGEISDSAMGWFTAARAVRASIEDLRAQGLAELARESETHLRRLLGARTLRAVSTEWLAQLPRYLKAEERRWQRLCARGGESPHILEECQTWERRLAALEQQLLAEQRWLAQLEELAWWVEEYRVSLYAQELGTLRPVSAARLEERAAAVERWLTR
jgi:ATP-dependent helicase HrpA